MSINFIEAFSSLPAPRVDRTKVYPLLEIVLLIVAGTLSGCEGWKSIKDFGEAKLEWLRKFLPYESGIPVDDTLARVMRKLDTKAFQEHFAQWMKAVSEVTHGEVIAIDGKTLRHSYNKKAGCAAIHMVSAWHSGNSLVLGQIKTEEKSNEITAIPELLETLDIKGCIVTIDAMGCQKKIAEKIIKKKGHYLLSLKGNHGHLHRQIRDYFEWAQARDFAKIPHDYFETLDKGHGRIEKRCCWVLDAKRLIIENAEPWKNLKTIVMVKSERPLKDQMSEETRFYLSSLPPEAEKLLSCTRQHWGIENRLHWTLDVTFREDDSRIRAEDSAHNFAIIRHIAMNLIRSDTTVKASVKRKRMMAALTDDFRETLIRQAI